MLAVYAHPDDELFHSGVLAGLSERGVRVTIACATAGEAGKVHPSVGAVTDLGVVRTTELRQSCARLGLDPPIVFDFHDSARKERQRHGDPRALANVDLLEVEAAICGAIEAVRPQVVLTFDPHGGYYHPDHVAIHRATTAAFFTSGRMGAAAPQRLFYGAMRNDVFRRFAAATGGRGILDGLDPDVFAVAPEMIAVSFDARPYMQRKLSALAAHRSQFGISDEMLQSPSAEVVPLLAAVAPVLEREVFILGASRVATKRWPLDDFFDDLDGFSAATAASRATPAPPQNQAARDTRDCARRAPC
jgi:N-acetyl-1-D-myo-inositol-2-amino-2-deoxy-alpha-D-glucopyranoside deacetylase